MNAVATTLLLCAAMLCGQARAAGPALPQRDLTMALRQVEQGREEGGSHYSAGSDSGSEWEPQELQVRNGEKALLRLNDAIPMQWTQSASGQQPGSGQGAGASASGAGNTTNVHVNAASSVTNALVWFDAGQSVSVLPKWPGGNKPAVIEIEVQRAAVDPQSGAALPKQIRNTVSTTITAPLAEWVTIAATGRAPRPGVYSSESTLQVRRLLQIRVMAP
jgi:hypothetical protein